MSAPFSDPLMTETHPDRYWSSTNTGEAMPGVMKPLDWTFFSHGIELGMRETYRSIGLFPKREVYVPEDPNQRAMGAFYGRVATNVDYVAGIVDRMPGASGADFERDLCGSVRPDVIRGGTDRKRVPIMAVRIPLALLRSRSQVDSHNATLRPWWRGSLQRLTDGSGDPAEIFRDALRRYDQAMAYHVRSRFLLMAMLSRVTVLAEKAGRPEAVPYLVAAVRTEETTIIEDLHELVQGRLEMRAFLDEHGYHGPLEAALSSESWREDQRPLDLALRGVAAHAEGSGPLDRHKQAVVQRERLEKEIIGLAGAGRDARLILRLARRAVVDLENSKAGTLLATDVGRAAAKAWGRQLCDQGVLVAADDIFYLTVEELAGSPPTDSQGRIAFRRAKREEYLDYDLPQYWEGQPTPIKLADVPSPERVSRLTGIGVSAGVYEGRACVVHDPAEDPFSAGEVLVCRVTDPSWMIALSIAGAVVLDIGGAASHGAVIAREFGIPCVVNTGTGTAQISSGDRVRVDGSNGVIEILEASDNG